MRQKYQPKRIEYLRLLDEQIKENWKIIDVRKCLIRRLCWEYLNMLRQLSKTEMWKKHLKPIRNYVCWYARYIITDREVDIRSKMLTIMILFAPDMFYVLRHG